MSGHAGKVYEVFEEDPIRFRIDTGNRKKLETILRTARQMTPMEKVGMPGSSAGSRLGTAPLLEADQDCRIGSLEAQLGIETPQGSRGPSRMASALNSRQSTGRPRSTFAQSASRSMLGTPAPAPGTPARPLSQSQSVPAIVYNNMEPVLPVINEIKRDFITRQVTQQRTYCGGFAKDAEKWAPEHAPVLPTRHRYLSSALWMNSNPEYKLYGEQSTMNEEYPDHGILGPPVRPFLNPRDVQTLYNEERFKVGNKLIMRKNTMVPKKD